MATKVTDADVNDLASAIAKALKTSGVGGTKTPTGGVSGASVSAAGQSLNVFDLAVQGAGKGVDAMKTAYDKVSKELEAGMGTWRDLTKSGISFNNDIIGMQVAAAGARVGLGEFSQTIKDNQVLLAGFGGGVGEGAKAFASLSKKMFDAGEATDSLRQLGYTNKELNDVLALQAGMIGSSMRKGAEKDEIAIKAAQSLAYEMDAMAKLTGKSREAQLESQKKLAADAAFQAKLDQATRNMDEKEAAEYRSKIMAEYTKAEASGLGQTFKETFTYGQVMSKQAATEQAVAMKAGTEVARAAQAAAAGNFEESSRRMSNAQDETIRNNKNANFQQMTIYGQFTGAAGEAAQKQYMANKAITDTIKALEKEPENRGKTEAELKQIAIKKIQDEQAASAGSTKAIINVEQRMNDLSSVMANSLVKPLNEQVNPELNRFADAVLGARSALVKGAPEKGVSKAAEEEIAAGRAQAQEGGKDRPKGLLQGVGYAAEKGGEYLASGVGAVNTGAEKLGQKIQRQGGSLEMSGKLFEDWGQGTMVELHGVEAVMRPEDLKKVVESSISGVTSSIPKSSSSTSNKLNIGEISKDISTTISSTVSGGGETTTRRVQSESSKEAEAELAKLKEQYKQDRAQIRDKIKTELGPDAKFSDIMEKMSQSIEAQDLSETYHKKQEELQKAIDNGITYEVEKKKSAVEETKKTVEETTKIIDNENKLKLVGVKESTKAESEIRSESLKKQLDQETKNAADLAKNIVGTMVEGLDDSQIEAMLPQGANVEDYYVDEGGALQSFSNDATVKQQEIEPNIPESFSDLISTTSPTQAQSRQSPIDINSFTLSKTGMPIPKPKSSAAAIPEKKEEANNDNSETVKSSNQSAQTTTKTAAVPPMSGTESGKSTLDDVVKSLQSLNMQVGQLISTSEEGFASVARSSKSMSNNLYERAKA